MATIMKRLPSGTGSGPTIIIPKTLKNRQWPKKTLEIHLTKFLDICKIPQNVQRVLKMLKNLQTF
jgi:hypothetical protein